ncbi:DUF4926 domain-containing protein [Bacillus alkalicellulosilyticus]|uniref:DUF4926 domain-containing protein n=1 Tax=Alkalihalobacterium alkalicellulosilyticum TaxID=1912214 RepID=UPI00148300DB|nr:DUF4926 domain-containing protein [Bacillus alkalicellulosilyticus]
MHQYNELDVVEIVKDCPKGQFKKGDLGAILVVFDENHFDIECCDEDGVTTFWGTLSRDWFKPYKSFSEMGENSKD